MRLGFFTLTAIALAACTSGVKETLVSVDQETDTVQSPEAAELWVVNGEDFTCQKQEREELLLVCLPYEGPYSKVMNNMKVAAMKIMESAYKQRWVMAGGIYIAMNELPKGSAPFSYRVGVPMKLFKNSRLPEFTAQVEKAGYSVLTMTAGEYVHALTNAEPGTASTTWTKVLAAVSTSGIPSNGPYFEYHSDSRNAEMTTVISQSHLVYKAQGEPNGTLQPQP
ncbi:MAG: hypothetical protein O3C22_05135 [Bacteroidetes bacterium]|nr:hypothetical protein [Bacteroidota bacterium]MDA1111550.1 hypothetical protein [Bacteroidota bacterium]